jgi:hypothetical protein
LAVVKHMARGNNSEDIMTLQMALVGYQIERQKIEEKIKAIEAQLGGRKALQPAADATSPAKPKRVLSASARRRIAAAQKKRWAEHRKNAAGAKA